MDNTLEHLAPYLPYGLKAKTPFGIHAIKGIDTANNAIGLVYWLNGSRKVSFCIDCKPILRPMSDLIKEIEHKGETFVPYLKLGWGNGTLVVPTIVAGKINVIEHYKLLSWHLDVFGLIDAGLAIDINTLKGDSTNA